MTFYTKIPSEASDAYVLHDGPSVVNTDRASNNLLTALSPSSLTSELQSYDLKAVPWLKNRMSRHRQLAFRAIFGLLVFFGGYTIASIGIRKIDRPVLHDSPTSSSNHFALSKLWPAINPDSTNNWQEENGKAMRRLLACMSDNSCGPNVTSIVLLSSYHFQMSIEGGTSGEDIWQVFLVCTYPSHSTVFSSHTGLRVL